jgi:hypothetical protein
MRNMATAAVIEWEPFYDPRMVEEEQPNFAPYSRMATCEEHGLQKVVTEGIINTGPGDTCQVGYMECGHIVAEDVF